MKILNIKIILILIILLLSSCNNEKVNIKEPSGIIEAENIISDSENFEKNKEKFLWAWYYKKSNWIYYFDKKIKQADKETFNLLNHPIWSEYAVDKNNAYWFWKFLKGAEIDSFEVTSFRYAKDNNNVYCFWEKLEWADPETFINTDFMDTYAYDKNNVYYNCYLMKHADNKTFTVFRWWEWIAKDKDNIYCGTESIKWADPETYTIFTIQSKKRNYLTSYSKDKNSIYYNCSRPLKEAHVETFEIINPFFAKDKKYVYHYNQIMEWVDPNNYTLEELEKKVNKF